MSTSQPQQRTLRGLEFYSGLGGFHYGSCLFNTMIKNCDLFVPPSTTTSNWYSQHLHQHPHVLHPLVDSIYNTNATQYQQSSPSTTGTQQQLPQPKIEIIESFDINPIANSVYKNNFNRAPNTTDISLLTPQQIQQYNSDIWFISNPCQPFTIQNEVNLDEKDPRTNSFLHLLQVLQNLSTQPTFLVLENVENFEQSYSYQILLQTLKENRYQSVSFILSPRQFGIPNQRSRFFLIASKLHNPLESFSTLFEKENETTNNINTQTIYRYLPTLHFIPDRFQKEYFGADNDLNVYRELWRDPDVAFDVVRATVKPPTATTTTHDNSDNQQSVDQMGEDIAATASTNETTISKNEDSKDNQDQQLLPISQRAHHQTRNRIVEESWLPAVIPSRIQNFLVDTTDLSDISFQSFNSLASSTDPQSTTTDQVESTMGDETSTTTTDDQHQTIIISENEQTTTAAEDVAETDIHKLLDTVKTTIDVDNLTQISKKEKNKLKRLLTKRQKQAEAGIKVPPKSQEDIQQQRVRSMLETAQALCLDSKLFLKSGVYTIDIVSAQDRSTCCFTKGYSTFFKGTGSILETYAPKARYKLSTLSQKRPAMSSTAVKLTTTMNSDDSTMGDFFTTKQLEASSTLQLLTTTTLPGIVSPPTPTPTTMIDQAPGATTSTTTSDDTVTTDNTDNTDELMYLSTQAPLCLRGLRYFLPREVANLQMLPPSLTTWQSQQPPLPTTATDQTQQQFPYFASFDWPQGLTVKQKLKLLGNSLNPYIIANLLLVLLSNADLDRIRQ